MESTATATADRCDHGKEQVDTPSEPSELAEARQRHQRLEPHLELLSRLAARLDDHDEQSLRSLLLAALNCADDDVLPHLEDVAVRVCPALDPLSGPVTRLIASQHRAVGRLRHELRDLAVRDLDGQRRREDVRRRLYELGALLRSLLSQEAEVCLPLLDATAHRER